MNSLVKVFSNFKEFYNEINGATLTGAIDVIVVEQPNGEFHCSPFHVRFGKLGVLRSREKIVDIEINGEPVDIHMKLGDSGEAFFVEECAEEDVEALPDNLATSPIPASHFPEKYTNSSSLNEQISYTDHNASRHCDAVGQNKHNDSGNGNESVNMSMPMPLPRRNSIDFSTEILKEADSSAKFENQLSDYSLRRHTDNTLERRNLSEKVKEYTTHKLRQKWAEHEEIFQFDSLGKDKDWSNSTTQGEEQRKELEITVCTSNNPITINETITQNEQTKVNKDMVPLNNVSQELLETSSSTNKNMNNTLVNNNNAVGGLKEESKSKKRRRRKSQLKKKNSLRKSSTSSSVSSSTPLEGMNEEKYLENSEDGNFGIGTQTLTGTSSAAETLSIATTTSSLSTTIPIVLSTTSLHNAAGNSNSSNDESSPKSGDGQFSAPLVTANTGDESLVSVVTCQTSPINNTRIPNLDIHFFSDTEISSTGVNCHSASSRGAGRPTTPVQSDSELEISMREKESDDNLLNNSASWKWGELPTPDRKEHHDSKTSPAQAQRNSMLSSMFNFMKKNNKIRQQGNEVGGIYLSELDAKSMNPEMMAMYFPNTTDNKSTSTDIVTKGSVDKCFHRNNIVATTGSAVDDDRESGNGTSIPHSPSSLDGQKSLDSDYEDGGKLEEARYLDLVSMSLCGLNEKDPPTREEFDQHLVTYKDVCENPSIFSSPNLVVRLNDKYYSWTTACPIVMTIIAFQKTLTNDAIKQLTENNNKDVRIAKVSREIDAATSVNTSNPTKRSWWYWRRSYVNANDSAVGDLKIARSNEKNNDKVLTAEEMMVTVEEPLDADGTTATGTGTGHDPTSDMSERTISKTDSNMNNENTSAAFVENLEDLSQASISKCDEVGTGVRTVSSNESTETHKVEPKAEMYKKSLRLSSNAIKQLNLKEGMNEIEFSVTTAYQGTTRCKCYLFHWKHNDKVVISDIDGTITKSDVLGHILPMMGKDWAQLGVAQLFSKIEQNGYKLLYLSARAIGQSRATREYLRSIRQGDVKLPDGPLLLNPTSLISAFHREVIERKPEQFKIACLTDIRELFPQKDPFYAGYGNRINDVWAYRAVGIPIKRIFTINTKGELKHELTQTFQSSYCSMTYIVDQLFPPVKPDEMAAIEYSHFNFWRDPLPELELSANLFGNTNGNTSNTGNSNQNSVNPTAVVAGNASTTNSATSTSEQDTTLTTTTVPLATKTTSASETISSAVIYLPCEDIVLNELPSGQNTNNNLSSNTSTATITPASSPNNSNIAVITSGLVTIPEH